MALGTKVAYFSLINVGSGFPCLRSFSFCLYCSLMFTDLRLRRVLISVVRVPHRPTEAL
jgi:hypothetical protein